MQIKPIMKAILTFGKKHATKFLAGGAIATEAIGFYFMHKRAPIARKKLDELGKDANLLDKIKVAGPVYLPAFLMFLSSSGCIIGGCALGEARLAAMTNLAMASEATLMRYEQKVIDTLGQDKANELQESIAKDLMKERPAEPQTIITTENGDDVFYDPLSGRYFTSSPEWIANAANKINSEIFDGNTNWVDVNQWYYHLGLEAIGLGKSKGWNTDKPLNYSLGDWESMPNGRPCRPILYFHTPVLFNGKED